MSIADRIALGVDFLDDCAPPEWWDRINLDELDLNSSACCVLGQVFQADADTVVIHDGYSYALNEFFADRLEEVVDCGFAASGEISDEYPELTAHWKQVISDRRAEVSA